MIELHNPSTMSMEPVPVRPAKRRASNSTLTDDHSFISKRSVERLYYPKEPSYLRHFIKQPQRRPALSNRCYWLQLKAIDTIVQIFLQRTSSAKKVVVDLGCGSDVLPWRCNYRYPEACNDALFVDVYHRDLLREKQTIVLDTPQLHELLGQDFSVSETDEDPILLKSPKYYQVDFDSSNMERLQATLVSIFSQWPEKPEVLFVAEVSTMYMEPSTADSLVQWASSIGKAEFCLVEQITPCGPDHFYSKGLLGQCGDIGSHPHSMEQYSTVSSQNRRFTSAGWNYVNACDLWEAWESGKFTTREDRLALDEIEPFHEWEDFILWCRHHVLVHASTVTCETPLPASEEPKEFGGYEIVPKLSPVQSKLIKRRFGGVAVLNDFDGSLYGMHVFGSDSDKILGSYDLFTAGPQTSFDSPRKLPIDGPPPRSHFTLTDLGDYGHLLVGGCKASGKACADSWVLRKGTTPSWERVCDLPVPVFRHSTVRIKGTSLALLIGGKTSSFEIMTDSFVFHPERGWLRCRCNDEPWSHRSPTFGGALIAFDTKYSQDGNYDGLTFGGLREEGVFGHEILKWSLRMTKDEPTISFVPERITDAIEARLLVFGAQAIEKDRNIFICGGMGATNSIQGQAITHLSIDLYGQYGIEELQHSSLVMIGHSVVSDEHSVSVFGGGATCVPVGAVWHQSSWSITFEDLHNSVPPILRSRRKYFRYSESPKILPQSKQATPTQSSRAIAAIKHVHRVTLRSEADFHRLVRDAKPVIIEGLGVGECIQKWTTSYMTEKVGHEQEVVVHECKGTDKLDFKSKNFQYITDAFASIMTRIEAGGKLYLRSLSTSKPSESPAKLEEDFPGLAEDFKLPGQFAFVKENIFSSILRISGRVNMWLHYDVMANIYTQIRGSKRMILFPPSDVSYLSFTPGASSSSLDVFSSLATPALAQTRPHEAHLRPGDILFLPPMWFHTATPTSDMSVAVNVFFRDLNDGYSAGRDVYGNRDLAVYERARQDALRIGKSFKKLPEEIMKFYLARIADELRGMAVEG